MTQVKKVQIEEKEKRVADEWEKEGESFFVAVLLSLQKEIYALCSMILNLQQSYNIQKK